MRRRPSDLFRFSVGAAALALAMSACSIEGPKIELIGQGGGGGGGGGDYAPGPGGVPTAGPATGGGSFGGGTYGGGTVGGGGGPGGDECKGKSTDTGVSPTTIKLGATFGVTGPVSNISGPILRGVRAYFNEVNAQGGVDGRKIDFKWYDDGWDAQKGKGLIKKLVEQDQVFVLTVVPSSNGLDAAKTYLESKQVPVFGTSGLIESQFRSAMQWPVGSSTKTSGRTGLVYLKGMNARNIAVIWLDLLAGKDAWDAIRNGTRSILGKDPADVIIGYPNAYRVGISQPDFAPTWAEIQQATKDWQLKFGTDDEKKSPDGRPDYVFLAIDPTNAIKALQAAEKMGFRPKVGWGGGAPLFLDLVWQGTAYAGQTGLGASTSYFPPVEPYLNNQAVKDYVRVVQKYEGKDVDLKNPYLEGGFAGAALTVEILKRVGPCLTRAKAIDVASNISGYSAAGLTPPLTYQKFGTGQGHYGNTSYLLMQVSPENKWRVAHDWIRDPSPGAD